MCRQLQPAQALRAAWARASPAQGLTRAAAACPPPGAHGPAARPGTCATGSHNPPGRAGRPERQARAPPARLRCPNPPELAIALSSPQAQPGWAAAATAASACRRAGAPPAVPSRGPVCRRCYPAHGRTPTESARHGVSSAERCGRRDAVDPTPDPMACLLLDRAPDPRRVRWLLGLHKGDLGGLRVLEGCVRVGLLRLRALPGVTGALLPTPRPPPLARCWPWGLCGLPGTRTPEHARLTHALWRASSARDEAGPLHMQKRQGEAGSACPHCTTVTLEYPDRAEARAAAAAARPNSPPAHGWAHTPAPRAAAGSTSPRQGPRCAPRCAHPSAHLPGG